MSSTCQGLWAICANGSRAGQRRRLAVDIRANLLGLPAGIA
ncbi:hypothetical protein [Streptomyces sp. NPDC008139]